MNLIKTILVIVVSVAVVFALQKFIGEAKAPGRRMGGGETKVETTKVVSREFADRIEAVGTAHANESVTITATVSDRVVKILFKEGATVKKGELLVELESSEEMADLQEARVDLAEQKREFKRMQNLRAKKVVSQQEFDTQKSAVDAAEARLAAAEARMRDRKITAPFSGVLGLRQVSPGALISTGETITTLDDLSVIKAEFAVPETFLAALKVGQTVLARSAAWPDERFEGTVSSIDSHVDASTRAVTVQAKIPNTKMTLRAGMLLTVDLISHVRNSLSVPEKSLLAYGALQYVFVLKEDMTVTKREVKLGRREAGVVEIIDGLKEGETIITEGVINLREGAKVTLDAPDVPEKSAGDAATTEDAVSK